MPFHNKFNASEREHPNPYITFITVLGDGPQKGVYDANRVFHKDKEEARHILKAIAAQVRPLMKEHGMGLNSLEEHEWNPVFAGRNWNGGEVIEIVLRKPDGSFLPMNLLLSVIAHELAHIHHMNHGSEFQKLNAKLRSQIFELRRNGYYGPGFWSAGARLGDSAIIQGFHAVAPSDLPEYTCGGAERRGTHRRRFRPRHRDAKGSVKVTDSNGRVKRRKAGGRVMRTGAFEGDGQVVDTGGESSFRKRANAKGAKETRAAAAEKRNRIMQGLPGTSGEEEEENNPEDDGEVEIESDWEAYRDADSEGLSKFSDSRPKLGSQKQDEDSLREEMRRLMMGYGVGDDAEGLFYSKKRKARRAKKRRTESEESEAKESDELEIVEQIREVKSKGKANVNGKGGASSKARQLNGNAKKSLQDYDDNATDNLEEEVVFLPKKKVSDGALSCPCPSSSKPRPQPRAPSSRGRPSESHLQAWECLVCLEINHADYAVCSSCARPKWTPAPTW